MHPIVIHVIPNKAIPLIIIGQKVLWEQGSWKRTEPFIEFFKFAITKCTTLGSHHFAAGKLINADFFHRDAPSNRHRPRQAWLSYSARHVSQSQSCHCAAKNP
jgi:hypothetical protein